MKQDFLGQRDTSACAWKPEGAAFWQAGHSGAGRAKPPTFDGTWWAVLALWPDEDTARAAAPGSDVLQHADAWHVVLAPASYRGDAELSGGARPFEGLPTSGKTEGASVVITLAGPAADRERGDEFFRRFIELGRDVRKAPGHVATLVQAADDGAQLTFSAWDSLRSAVTWAYHRPTHAQAVARQEEHQLLRSSGFLRCAVLSSTGHLGDQPDPLAGLTGAVTPRQERP